MTGISLTMWLTVFSSWTEEDMRFSMREAIRIIFGPESRERQKEQRRTGNIREVPEKEKPAMPEGGMGGGMGGMGGMM